MKKLVSAVAAVLVLGFTGAAHADFVGNRASKFFFPDTCSYAAMIKPANQVPFKTAADALAAGYKTSAKCQSDSSTGPVFVGNKSSKQFFPADCGFVKLIKAENKVTFNTAADAAAAGYTASSKCVQ